MDGSGARGGATAQHRMKSARVGSMSRAALDLLPGPVAVVDEARAIVLANQRFDLEMRRSAGDTCCDAVGCRTATGDGSCIVETVLRSGASWRGTVVPPGGGPARELEASPLDRDERFVVLQLSEPEAAVPSEEAVLRVHCLGPLRIGGTSEEMSPDWLDQRPGMLLKYLLAMRHRHVRPEEVAEALWPATDVAGAGTVRYVVHQLRKRLEPELPSRSQSRYVLKHARGYRLDPSAVWVDADEFESSVRAGVAAVLRDERQTGEQALLHALSLYRGEFLYDDPHEEWALPERDRLHAMLETPLRLLIEMRLSSGDLEGAAAFAERLANHEPLDADVQRLALELLLRQGRRSRAVRHYGIFRARLWRTLGVTPPFELADLFRDVP